MNYQLHYDRLIAKARGRSISGYVEKHHVIPRCMGGSDEKENLVQLTAEEHFVAHQLLRKMFPKVRGLAFAMVAMTGNAHGHRNNKVYGWIRRDHIEMMSGAMKELWERPGYRERQQAAMDLVRKRPGYREQFSRIHRGRVKSEQERANISAARKGMKYKPMSDESRQRMSAARKKVWAERKANGTDKAVAAKIKETRIKNGTYAFSAEHRAAIGAAQKGRKLSAEHKENISASMKTFRSTH